MEGNFIKNGSGIVHDEIIAKAKDGQSLASKIGIALGIVLDAGTCFVRTAVTLDNKLGLMAVEIAEIVAELVLSAEFCIANLTIA
jgi:hypothetical protein